MKTNYKNHKMITFFSSPTRELAQQIHEVLANFLSRMTHLTQQLFIGGTNINTDVEKFKHEGGNIIIGTPGRIEDLLMGKTDSSHRNLFVQAAKTLVSHHNRPEDLKKSRPKTRQIK